ncbi:ALBINO3-like protein 2, chloroplastic isoform B [Glycine soja]|uniref:ALBINO3-like protein 2, chloroplastic isoform B n=2 Tax=Glycine subgen. Soja TaxID=1462606 RepID=A0A445J630_GLYSO|nr:ALBINO3-like protein 2, chloroplastic isoform B [Glycine soja]
MSPKELITLAVLFLNSDDKESAIPLLKLALDKDPEYVRALVLMGRVLLLKHVNDEAHEYFERAISKLSLAEEVDLPRGLELPANGRGNTLFSEKTFVSQVFGYMLKEGLNMHLTEGIFRYLARKEPEDPTSKGYYFDGLVLLSSTLFDSGQKAEAAKYLRLVVAYKPGYKKFLELCEKDDDIASDLTRSRRELQLQILFLMSVVI